MTVLTVSGAATGSGGGHFLMSSTRGMQSSDEEHVENKQRNEGSHGAKHQVAADLVDDVVQLVVS